MPINTEAEDNNNSNNGDELFHLLKKLSSINIGGRDNDGNPHKFFSDNDIAALQNTTLFQQLNTSEFKPGIEGAPKPTWASYLSLGSDTLSEQGLGFVKTEHNLTWQTNFTGTEAEIVRAREKAWAQAVSNVWVGFVSKWYIANDFANVDNGVTLVAENGIVIDNALMPVIGGMGFVVGQTIPASFQGFNAIFNVAFSSEIDAKISSNSGVDPGSGSVEIKTFVDSLQTTSIAFTAGSESNILFKEYYKYFDRDTGELRDQISSSGGSIIDSINKLYAPNQANAFLLEDAGVKSIYDVYNYTFKILETFQTRAGQIVAGLDVADGFIHKETNEIVEEIPDGDDPALYEQNFSKRPVYDEFTNYFIEEGRKAGLTEPVTTMLSGIMFNHFLIKNLNFTGLHDTPTGYQSGSFLYSTSSGIEYSSFDGNFTGLFDTPTGYVSGYYTRSSETGIEYISATGVADDIISSMTGIGGTYLKLKDTGTGIEFVDVGNIEGTFTGLHDTPTGYESGYYLMSNKTGIEYISPTGLAKDIADTIVTGQFLAFTGLNDTPTGYESGYYLRSTETGIEYISPTGLAKDIADTIATGQFLAFTGLNDTPEGYENLSVLQSSNNSIQYTTLDELAGQLPVIPKTYISTTNLPSPASDHDGEVVKVGCNLYISCNGEWVLINDPSNIKINNDEYPGCIETLSDFIDYYSYTQDKHSEFWVKNFISGLNRDPGIKLYSVCTVADNGGSTFNNHVSIDQTNFKYGMFEKQTEINITATAHESCSFKNWTGDQNILNNIGDKFNSNTNIIVNDNLSITGVFDCGLSSNPGTEFSQTINVEVINSVYVFNGVSSADSKFKVNTGTYTFQNVPPSHPIAFLNNGDHISVGGSEYAGQGTAPDGLVYNFYHGTVVLNVLSDFGAISYACLNHGYMGPELNLEFDSLSTVYPNTTFNMAYDYSTYTDNALSNDDKDTLNLISEDASKLILDNVSFPLTVENWDDNYFSRGVNGVLAYAGPRGPGTFISSTDYGGIGYFIPTAGGFAIDPLDVSQLRTETDDPRRNSMYWVLFHELMHALGIGTFWNVPLSSSGGFLGLGNNFIRLSESGGAQYIGEYGVYGYNKMIEKYNLGNANQTAVPIQTKFEYDDPDPQNRDSNKKITKNFTSSILNSSNIATVDGVDHYLHDDPWQPPSRPVLVPLPNGVGMGDTFNYNLHLTWGGHWSEFNPDSGSRQHDGTIQPLIDQEIMTPLINIPQVADISMVTIGFLKDLQYNVDFSKLIP